MSLDATRWAWQQRCGKGVDKLVLMSMADRADEAHCCYPSISRLTFDTELNRKTVQGAISRMVESGLILDTGKRKGRTGQVKVYQLVGVPDRYTPAQVKAVQKANVPINGALTKNRPEDSAVITPEQPQIGNEPIKGIVSIAASKEPGYGLVKEPIYGLVKQPIYGLQNLPVESTKEPTSLKKEKLTKEKQEKEIAEKEIAEKQKLKTDEETENVKPEKYKGIELTNLPDGLTIQSAKNFIDHRKAIKKPLTQHGFSLYLSALQSCTDCGLNLNQIVDETIDAGWQSIKPAWLKNRLNPPSKLPGYRNQQDDSRPRKELVG